MQESPAPERERERERERDKGGGSVSPSHSSGYSEQFKHENRQDHLWSSVTRTDYEWNLIVSTLFLKYRIRINTNKIKYKYNLK